MSEAEILPNGVGPEHGALLATRRWLIVVSATVGGGLTVLIGALLFPRLSMVEHASLALAAVLLVVGLIGSRRQGYLWLTAAGLMVLILTALVAPSTQGRWIPLNVLVGYTSYYIVMLTPRRVGMFVGFASAAGLALIWSRRPANVIVANLALVGGWIAVLQVLASSLLVWWTWNGLRDEASSTDATLRGVQARTLAALQIQERARLWRSTAVHLHESVLNSIRYVLTAPDVDRERLSVEVEGERALTQSPTRRESTSLTSLVHALQQDAGYGEVVTVTGWIPDIPIDPDVYEAVRAAAIELVRNAVRHGGASVVSVGALLDVEGRAVLRLVDNGATAAVAHDPSVGRSTTLGTALSEVGGQWEAAPAAGGGWVSRISFPRPGEGPPGPYGQSYPPFDKGRLIVTAAIVGIIVCGSLYYVHMVIVGPVAERLAGLLGLVGTACAVGLFLRRRRVHPSLGLALVMAPAMVPWFLLGDTYTCQDAAPLSPVLNIAGYTVLLIATWSGRLPGVVGIMIWGISGGLLVRSIPAGCRDSVAVALINSLVALPVIIAVTYAGAQAYQRALDQGRETRQKEIVERSTAAAAEDINNQLDASVREAELTLALIASGAHVDAESRERLMRLDARIRAGIQVDPQSDGSMAVLAKAFVDVAADQGRSVSVRAITCSSDTRPIPMEVQRLLFRILVTPAPLPPRLRVFTDGEEDHLSIMATMAALRSAGLRPGEDRQFEDVVIEVEDGGDEDAGRLAVVVSRPIVTSVTKTAFVHAQDSAGT